MGVIAIIKVITRLDRTGRPVITQLGNREWVTVIKIINTCEFVIPPLVILEGVIY